ncbi:type II toxin-antitoxin system HicB family antitoxin [Eubacterium aggregans]|uniref:type II toxin-antitoxin system HicB family antitoxin n=1 Tax=Eubacterium aggregans TaxID=81409 RepID=UPI003F3CDB62
MRKVTYLAVLEPGEGDYSVYFPDVPGCVSYGDTLEKALEMAQEALELHVYGMEKDGDPLPKASGQLSEEDIDGNIVSPISIFPDLVRMGMDNRRVKTNVTIPSWLKDEAEAKGANFSRMLEMALVDYVGVREHRRM